ncbi:serine/threonine protein kinase [Planctomicrobium sp. SH664]|uniref:serine/threonine protein kinase n=1 Tax=Planctomicrobium sp. SH664 TaxID=3448125 RepID=UPI003F5CA083
MAINLLKIFRNSGSSRKSGAAAHMTWGHTSLGRTVSRTGVFLRKQIWIWPIIATVMLAVLAVSVQYAIESTMKSNLQSQVQTLLNVETAMLENWCRTQEANASSLAHDAEVREEAYALVKMQEEPSPNAAAERVEILKRLRRQTSPMLSANNYIGYLITDKSKRILAASNPDLVGKQNVIDYGDFLDRALKGTASVSTPMVSTIPFDPEAGQEQIGQPIMFVAAPIRNTSFEIVGALALGIRPDAEFTRIMQLGRFGETGETYAIDKKGTMVSNSRFDESLILLGILPDRRDSRSILNVEIRDPQHDMTLGFRPKVRRSELPLTLAAEEMVAGRSGVNVEGYNDYRGVPVVGAWAWLPKEELGVASEIDLAEAFRPLMILKRTFWALYTLLGLSSLAIFIFTIIVARLRREAQKAEIEAKQLGQYKLAEKLGSGGMGVVYKGHHAMLRRPTAIKMLDLDKVNDASVQRFEREVQITCQLNHPNTIAIYDYGRTPEGVFYYAMEYLDGISLQSLVEKFGPQPESRVIHILMQACGSLYEAHSLGLVHRDIKPANMMLNRRGGEADVLKVLDFGLVKALNEEKQAGQSAANTLTGTPLYMAPEAIQAPASVDGRSDLYALGAVGYFLLTGKSVFEASNIVELCRQHVDVVPIPPSQRSGRPVSAELEDAIMSCLEKSRGKRPNSARDLSLMLGRSPFAHQWTLEEADAWWGRYERGQHPQSAGPNVSRGTPTTAFQRTIVGGKGDD